MRRANVIPLFSGIPLPRWILGFEMIQAEDSVDGMTWYRRNNIFFGLIPIEGYILRKIVDKNGQKTPAFNDMLAKVEETCIVVTKSDN